MPLARLALGRGEPAYHPQTRLSAVAAVVAAGVIIALGVVCGIVSSRLINVVWSKLASGDPPEQTLMLVWLTSVQLCLAGLTLAAARLGGPLRSALALGPPAQGRRVYLESFLLLVLLVAAFNAVLYSAGPTDIVTDLRPFVPVVRSSLWPLAALAIGLGAPIAEELLFRGFLMSSLSRSRLGFRGAAVATSFAWTAMHAGYSAAGLAEVMMIGLYLSWVLWRTGSLRVTMFCHAA